MAISRLMCARETVIRSDPGIDAHSSSEAFIHIETKYKKNQGRAT